VWEKTTVAAAAQLAGSGVAVISQKVQSWLPKVSRRVTGCQRGAFEMRAYEMPREEEAIAAKFFSDVVYLV
jgi:hypothetical protein